MAEEKKDLEPAGQAAGLYKKLESERFVFLTRAREASKFTIPTLVPPAGHSNATKYYTPYQSVGARGVNNLASKLLLALLPPNSPFFRLQIDDFTLEELTKQEGMRAKVEEGLNKIERAVQGEIEGGAIRVSAFEAMKHLLVSGNALLYLPDAGGMRVFPLERFVVRRDPMGKVLDIVTKEEVAPSTLDEKMQIALGYKSASESENEDREQSNTKAVELYTHIYREDNKWEVYQEIKGVIVPGSQGYYPIEKSPWIPVRFTKIDGESYGRGYVEEYLGDIKSLEGLSQAIVEGSAAAAKVLFLVNPNGTTNSADLAEAGNGAFVQGLESDVSTLQLQKYNDFRVALETMNQISERLSYAFLLNSAIQRNGERVTAEEIRYMAGELESALGGIYSILSQEMQLPMVNRIMFAMERKKKMPTLPKGTVTPVIVTGMEALGRGNDLNKLETFIAGIAQIPNAIERINWSDYVARRGTALGIDMKGLVKSDEQMAQEAQAAQQQAMMQQALQQGIAPAVQAAGKIAEKRTPDGSSQTS